MTRCYFGKVLEDVVVRRISENIERISVEIFVDILSIKEYTTTSVFGTHTKLKILTQTPHMKSKFKYRVTLKSRAKKKIEYFH
jgi:hypothetical protein